MVKLQWVQGDHQNLCLQRIVVFWMMLDMTAWITWFRLFKVRKEEDVHKKDVNRLDEQCIYIYTYITNVYI